jgi:hypothetical protein
MFNVAKKMVWRRGKASVAVRTTFGSKEFPPDVEVLVPPRLIQGALAIGIEFVDENEQLPELVSKDTEPMDPGSRAILIKEAIAVIVARAKKNPKKYREQFTAGNRPKVSIIAKEAGLNKVGAHEIAAIYEAEAEEAAAKSLEQKRKKAAERTEAKNPKPKAAKVKPGVTDESGAEDR